MMMKATGRCSKLTTRHQTAAFSSVQNQLKQIDFQCTDDPKLIGDAFEEYGCAVVRGLNKKYVKEVYNDCMLLRDQTLRLFEKAKSIPEGAVTPDGSLIIPKGDSQEQQIMVLGLDYFSSAALLQVSIDEKLLDIVESCLQDRNIELFGKGQILLKEKDGGHAKLPHQDAAYFEFEKMGPVGTLNYCVDTNLTKNNGPLRVWPKSHKQGYIQHIDTESHLALRYEEWPDESGVIIEGNAGDCILFHQYCVHGSSYNFSGDARPVFINRYIQCHDQPIMPLATSVKMRAEALEKAKTVKPSRDMGYMVRGSRIYNANLALNSEARDKQFH